MGVRLTALLLTLLTTASWAGAAPVERMPRPVKAKLDAAFPGWRMAPLSSKAARSFRSKHPSWPSNVLTGDFDGNKRTDYAALLEHKGQMVVAALLDSGKALTVHTVMPPEQPDPRLWLWLVNAGATRTDLDTKKPVTFRQTSIGLNDGGSISRTFIFERGKFREIRTSD